MLSRLFVYGTLRQGECRHHLLQPAGIRSVVAGSVPGTLFDFGEYPGMTLSRHGDDGRVIGEVIEFKDLSSILAALDEEEGPAYRREVVSVDVPGSVPLETWTYVVVSVADDAVEIASGDWRKRST